MLTTGHHKHGRTTTFPGTASHRQGVSTGHRAASAASGGTTRSHARDQRSADQFVIEPLDGSSSAYALPTYCG
ncbi:hypothetical protein ABGB17_26630 [Sphaerisporangium sp. B11E5]|uniref:hypothetical protein n=1 Tax=Sphaerisporangium sp. B11E5 TaxID=3153563 RepID=UPI00325E6050